MIHRRLAHLVSAIGVAILLAFLAHTANLQGGTLSPSYTDFEEGGFVAGNSVNDTAPDGTSVNITNINNCVQAWRVGNAGPTTEDEEIVDLMDGDHGKVWRLSQGAATGSLGNAPHSPNNGDVTPITAGETGASNDAGCGAPTTPNFYGEVGFSSVTGAAQAGLNINVMASSGDTRHAYVSIIDDGAGFDIGFFETADGCQFPFTSIDTNLSYADWHTLGIEIFFVDGLTAGTPNTTGAYGNDVVNVYADGTLIHTGTTWESCVGARSVDRLAFSASSIPGQLGDGLYFDDVLVTDVCPAGRCNVPVDYDSVGECISSRFEDYCVDLKGKDRAECNQVQQDYCFDLFGQGRGQSLDD